MGSLGTTTSPPRKIDLVGTPREIGVEHGRQLRQEIRGQIGVYEAMFQQTSKLDWQAVKEVSKAYALTIQQLAPDVYTEIEGIAEGAELDILDIVALNARSEIALGLFSDGCSSLGWKRQNDVLLAQNWDWTTRVKQNCCLMSIKQENKPAIWMVTEAGIVGKIGFNSAGVGTCLNAIRAKPIEPTKLPIHIALRVCLDSKTKAEAIARMKDLGGVASAQHILIADADGPLSLEVSPKGDVQIEPDANGLVCHTNHMIENKLMYEPPWLAGSPVRLDRIRQLSSKLAASGTAIDGEVLRGQVFSDTFNAPQAICCQEDPKRPIETRSSTLFNIVMKLGAGNPSAEVVWGQPGSGKEGEVLHMPW
ncbi:uncharacterized protein HMPREF1541_00746 [Cyphellophora europaea CBS 101466]|uniref:Peptidase C45 hydrolase domain-containing protein n=1 Tax=Cyphellophora europaea (strain CBS 101466) TaxID=1220924 RepID=W2SCW0_CYPE1|nr:uncharacterized protein HMPREF1541_00746 [Cyphellophora europaea CBS 101466]ETN46561.1 hypothetical protein HMPREF1541_00746 [Cyphellophora europaea CBS 101466]